MNSLRARFYVEAHSAENPAVLVVAIKLPSGAIETITNTELLHSKINYYTEAYDEEFKLKNNPEISIVGFMLVEGEK